MTRAQLRAPAPVRVVWDGQSVLLSPPGDPALMVPGRTMTGLAVPHVVVAVGGRGWEEGAGGISLTDDATTRLFPQVRPSGIDVLVMCGGQSDLINGTVTDGDEIYARACTYRDNARAAGFDVVVGCTMPPLNPSAFDGDWIPFFTDHNEAMRSDAGSWDLVIDLWQPPIDLEWSADPAHLYDGLHPTALAAQQLADIARPALAGLIDTPSGPTPGFEEFSFTGAAQTFTVPAGVTSITATLDGASGGPGAATSLGGSGARVVTTLTVTPSESIGVYVGGAGVMGDAAPGGWNGGGAAGDTGTNANRRGGSGGGASDLRRGGSTLTDRVAVAGGGGGGAGNDDGGSYDGGDGGTVGLNGNSAGGTGGSNVGSGGSQSAGGAGGSGSPGANDGGDGALGLGGLGGGNGGNTSRAGGGGGGGLFGGGGGGASTGSSGGAGGGGGSSMSTGTATSITDGHHTGNGHIRIEWG